MTRHKQYLEDVVGKCEDDFEGDIDALINRHQTLEAGNQELHISNNRLTVGLDQKREEWKDVQTNLQNEHLQISSKLHECRMNLERYRRESQELESQYNRALEEKQLKDSLVGIIHMAIEQLFFRIVSTCSLPQRKKAMFDSVDSKYGHKLDLMLEAITGRLEDLRDIHSQAIARLALEKEQEVVPDLDEKKMDVQWVTSKGQADGPVAEGGGGSSKVSTSDGASQRLPVRDNEERGHAPPEAPRQRSGDTFLTAD